ncbi:MAG: type II toxin-antitoxin system VapC family toxin [Deltaproteobacteria bacterium]|nr:type II toxin-antitoxin system VapC family toxin [Deltaproteobacteria bacterium]
MTSYADTGFLCSLYAPDAHTARAARRMQRQALPLPITWLHQLELRNALRLRVFRREITARERDASLNMMLADLAAGALAGAAPDLGETMIEAERLSALHSERLGTRSLDVLHVAAAVVLGRQEFLSFDRRQANLARAAGLRVPTLA